MRVALTGGTGYLGSSILRQLTEAGHSVVALVRSDSSAAKAADAGATPAVGDFGDAGWLAEQFADADAGIHAASPSDATSASFDATVAAAANQAYAGAGKTYLHTGGCWVWGDSQDIKESDPYVPPAITAWRGEVEQVALGIAGTRTLLMAPGILYGHGGGLPNLIVSGPHTDDGALTMIGDGSQHWCPGHVDDVAAAYVLALATDSASGTYLLVSGVNPTVRELSEAASRAAGLGGKVAADSVAATKERLSPYLAEALLLDQSATPDKARDELGWTPSGPTLTEELGTGSYARA